MSKLQKRPYADQPSSFHTAKKRKPNNLGNGNVGVLIAPEAITNLRQIYVLLTDLSSPQALQKGYQSFRSFLQGCVPDRSGPTAEGAKERRSETDVVRNKAILREWVESESQGGHDEKMKGKKSGQNTAGGEKEREIESEQWTTVVQGLGFANQSGNHYLLSAVASALALLVRTLSTIPELSTHGAGLCKVLLEPANIKLTIRGITSHQERVASPMLRLLTEINKFNLGEFCNNLYSSIDFSTKDLGKNLEPKKISGSTASGETLKEDPSKPTVRTVYIRFILSFFHYGTPTVKQGLLSKRNLITPIFKHIKLDSPQLINDLLETLKTKVVNDSLVPRVIKSQVFNEWVLGHISALYSRPEPINELGDQSKTVARAAHDFLIALCTKPGSGGVCFPDNGWYPPAATVGGETEEEKHAGGRVFNRTLAAFITTLKPSSDTLQQDLLLQIFTAAPELVAPYFTSPSSSAYPFDPKLSATWIGYCAFLTLLVQLPLPKGGFGFEGSHSEVAQLSPPPILVVLESVLPKVCTRQVMTKCLSYENALVRYLSIRFMVAAFQKLSNVIAAMENVARQFPDDSPSAGRWLLTRGELIEEFSRRTPELGPVVAVYNSAPVYKTGGGLAREAIAKLLMQYYTLLPEVALGKRFDVNIALGSFLEDEEGEVKGLRLLEMEHLLGVAKEAGDVKWWSKGTGAPYSSFTMVMRLCIPGGLTLSSYTETYESSLPLSSSKQVKTVLRAALDQTHIFQQETAVDPFDALLESIATARMTSPVEAFNAILTFVDDCMVRCVRIPFKYLDEAGSLITSNSGHVQTPMSSLVTTLAEQLSFVFLSKEISDNVKKEVIMWVARFLENLRLAGENANAIAVVGRKLISSLEENGAESPLMKLLQTCDGAQSTWYTQDQAFKAQTGTIYPPKTPVLCTRSIFPTLKNVDVEILDKVMKAVEEGKMNTTTFDISLLLNGISILADSHVDQHLSKIFDLLECMILQVKKSEGENRELISKVKIIVAGGQSGTFLTSFISGRLGEPLEKRYIEILALLFENGYEEPLQPLVEKLTNFLSTLDKTIDDRSISSRISRFERLIAKLVPTEIVKEMVFTVLEYTLQKGKPVAYKISAILLKCVVERLITLDVHALSGLLAIIWKTADNDMIKDLRDVLGNYLAQITDIPLLESAMAQVMEASTSPSGHDIIEKLARQAPEIIRVLLGKIDSVRRLVVEYLKEKNKPGVHIIIVLLKALLESLTISTTKGYVWKDLAGMETKTSLRQVLEDWKQEFLAPETLRNHPEVLAVFSRMVVLFPQIDMGDILKHILRDTQRSYVTPEAVSFISSLVKSNPETAKDGELAAAKKGWLLMMVDNLTRRFGEEKILSEKSTHLAKEFAWLLKENNITLSDWVPRGSFNALLEAAVEKKIEVEEVLGLVGEVVSTADAKSLDLAKLLQIILGNSKNPLAFRENRAEMIHYYAAWLIYKLFILKKEVNSNISTLEGVLVLYRGTCSVVDKLLLEIMTAIEGHLTQSCASRISTWSFLGDRNDASVSSSTILISRQKGSLMVTIDEELLTTSVAHYSPEGANKLDQKKVGDWEQYLEIIQAESNRLEKQYDHTFMLPVLGYLIASKGKDLGSGQNMVEKGAVGYTIIGLSSCENNVRTTAMQVLSGIISRLEESVYRARNQINHLLCALLASLESDHNGTNTETSGNIINTIDNYPLPTIVTVFLAHSTQEVLPDPGHFYYETIMEMLLRSPLLDIWDIPHLLSSSLLGSEDEHFYKVVNWKLNILSCGLRSEIDLNLYRKRRVFESVLAMYMNPYVGGKTKAKIVDLLWNLAEVKGGGMTAITRNGVIAWVRGLVNNIKCDLLVEGNNMGDREREKEKVVWKVVVGRLVEMADRKHLREWGRGELGSWVDEIYTA